MKKLLLTLAFAAAMFNVSAQDEAPVQAETVTTDAEGYVTITDNLVVAGENGLIPNSKSDASAPSKSWKVADDAEVEYVNYRANFVNGDSKYFQTTNTEGSYFEFKVQEYNCSKVTITSFKSGVGGKFNCYANNKLFKTISIVRGTGDVQAGEYPNDGEITIEIPEDMRAAGTVYRIETAYIAADPANGIEEQFKGRLQMTAITYTCTATSTGSSQWEAPVCNIKEDGSYLLSGQVIKFTCEDGGTVTGTVSYKKLSEPIELSDGEYTIPELTDETKSYLVNGGVITVSARVTGKDKEPSDEVTYNFRYTNGTNLIFTNKIFSEFKTTKVLGEAEFYYNLSVLNFGNTKTTITVKAELYSHEDEPRLYKTEEKTISPENTAALLADGEVSPVSPVSLKGFVKMTDIATGGFYAKMAVKIADGKYQYMTTDSGQEMREVRIEGTTSGVEDVAIDAAEAVYYTLSGVRVEPAAGMGVLIRVCNGKATKVAF